MTKTNKTDDKKDMLQNAKNELERIFDAVPDLISILNKNQEIIRVNRAFCEKIEKSPDECIGKKCYEIFHKDASCLENCPLRIYLKTGDIKDIEVQEEIGEYKISIYPLKDKNGKLESFVHVAHDISHRKMYEKQLKETLLRLQETNEDLEEFAYVASHDLQEPLRKVITFGTMIEEKINKFPEAEKEIKEYLERMISASNRMRFLIDDLLQYSRAATDKNNFEFFDLNDLIDDLLENIFDERIKETKPEIIVDNLPVIEGDKKQLTQLFQNVLSNCFKFQKKNIRLEINISATSYPNENLCTIAVKDNGIGFDNIYNKKIFDTFQRLHTKDKYKGSGIGLSICKRIALRHKGEIYASSELNKGASFFINLPLTQTGHANGQKDCGTNC